ncbi:MAG: helix-hairpin-helix domain-containing protein [Steroidobacteraceae bacterium]
MKFPPDWQKGLWGAMAAISLAGAGLYLNRDARETFPPGRESFGPEEGSLQVKFNAATKEEFESIPGTGPALAAQIIAGRPYSRVEDLECVHGLGRNLVESLRPYVKVEGPTVKRSE